MSPRYSVVIPAYNAESTIDECLRALDTQSIEPKDYEVIVVDDGSTDQTAEIIKRHDVTYIYQQNAGPARARNHGAEEAKGRIILFTDSDCVASGNWIEEMVRPLEENENVSAAKGAYRTRQSSLTARFAQVEFEERFEILKNAKSIDMIDTYAAAFRSEVFRGAGGFDESFTVANNEDTELSYKLSSSGHLMLFNPEAIVYHLKHPDSPKKYFKLKLSRGYWRMMVYKRFPKKMIKDSYTPKTLKIQTLAMLATLGLGLLLPLSTYVVLPFFLAFGLFIFSSMPFTAFALTHDPAVGVLAPFFLALRALAIGLGVVAYFLGLKLKKPKAR